ncbi:MAG: DUF72 domain-containing protein [Candidatus Latescibacterota bacterium]|nr:DUF72 domain-containing protein [Candidatus Latescibacterota bacterium]
MSGPAVTTTKEWRGPFYPEKLPAKEMLAFYGEHFRSVEINNSFYRVPKSEVVQNWAQTVLEDFQFVMKAPSRIAHFKRLKDVGQETEYFISVADHLRDRFGASLFQFPPNFKKDMERLQAFVDLLLERLPVATEFRQGSWFDDEARDCLRAGYLTMWSAHKDDDTEEEEALEFGSTAHWGHLRLRGSEYRDEEMQSWAQRVLEQERKGAFVFFKCEDEGFGPRPARRFLGPAWN